MEEFDETMDLLRKAIESLNEQTTREARQTEQDWKPARMSVYCGASKRKSSECDKVFDVAEKWKHLSSKKLCFNCTGKKHRASECHSKRGCQICSGKHHTPICDKTPDKMLTATGEGTVTYPAVVVIVNGVKC